MEINIKIKVDNDMNIDVEVENVTKEESKRYCRRKHFEVH